jgi:predicted ATPase/class 3 adenylate cyclase
VSRDDDLPVGTVTFLFTDIERSTELLRSLGRERYAATLRLHHELLRRAWVDNAGYEVDTAGDGFLVAFAQASAALAAAAQAQSALRDAEWPHEAVRVRMGVHSGEATIEDGHYVGLSVHRAARICAAGHGGQVVVSQSVIDLSNDEPTEVSFRALGFHRLKDLPEPQALYQLDAAGSTAEFPPLRSLNNTNLPAPASPLVGREAELELARSLILEEQRRLVTVTGAGGTGKTRFSLEVALDLVGEFRDGVFFVPLAPVADPGDVVGAIVAALRVQEQPGRDPAAVLQEHLSSKRLLLLVDNVEHVIEAASLLGELLAGAPQLVMLATGREALRIGPECELPLDPLVDEAAAELFVARVRDSVPDFDDSAETGRITEICRQVDGLPLALELAAARVKLLGIDGLLTALDHRLDVLRGTRRDVPARQQTLRSTIEWSYDLLSEEERRVCAELAVFADGATFEAADEVCRTGLDVLGSLLDKSLLRRRGSGDDTRVWLLQTIREFGQERLEEKGRLDAVRDRHLAFYSTLATEAAPELWRRDQGRWLNRLDRERDNLGAALTHGLLGNGDVEQGARLAAALQDYWDIRGHFDGGSKWLMLALERKDDLSEHTAARVATGAAVLLGRQLVTADLVELLTDAAETLRRLGALSDEVRARGLLAGWLAGRPEPHLRARAQEFAARARAAAAQADDEVARFLATADSALVASFSDPAVASAQFTEALAMCVRRGDRRNASIILMNLGVRAADVDCDRAGAEDYFAGAAAIGRELDDPLVLAASLSSLAQLALLGDGEAALPRLREAVRLARDHGCYVGPECLACAALVAARDDDKERAVTLLAAYERAISLRTYSSTSPTTAEVVSHARASVAEALDERTARAADAAGKQLSLSAAFDLALRALEEVRPASAGSGGGP